MTDAQYGTIRQHGPTAYYPLGGYHTTIQTVDEQVEIHVTIDSDGEIDVLDVKADDTGPDQTGGFARLEVSDR